MSAVRNGLCVLIIIALAVPLAGFIGGENSPFSEHARASIVGGVVSELKKKDDEAELTEIRQYGVSSEQHERAADESTGEQDQAQEQDLGQEQEER